jgi:hypothetical protein
VEVSFDVSADSTGRTRAPWHCLALGVASSMRRWAVVVAYTKPHRRQGVKAPSSLGSTARDADY